SAPAPRRKRTGETSRCGSRTSSGASRRCGPSCSIRSERMAVRISPTLAGMATYPFVRLEEARRRLEADGVSVIDFGKGDPNEPTDPIIRQALVDGVRERMSYPLAAGLPELRRACAEWCGRRFGVALDPDSEV